MEGKTLVPTWTSLGVQSPSVSLTNRRLNYADRNVVLTLVFLLLFSRLSTPSRLWDSPTSKRCVCGILLCIPTDSRVIFLGLSTSTLPPRSKRHPPLLPSTPTGKLISLSDAVVYVLTPRFTLTKVVSPPWSTTRTETSASGSLMPFSSTSLIPTTTTTRSPLPTPRSVPRSTNGSSSNLLDKVPTLDRYARPILSCYVE